MRARSGLLASVVGLVLAGCATAPRPQAACVTSNTGPEADALFAALQKYRPDPQGHRVIVAARTFDGRGDIVKDVTVWPMSGPQEPAPGEPVRVVLKPCTYKLVKVERRAG